MFYVWSSRQYSLPEGLLFLLQTFQTLNGSLTCNAFPPSLYEHSSRKCEQNFTMGAVAITTTGGNFIQVRNVCCGSLRVRTLRVLISHALCNQYKSRDATAVRRNHLRVDAEDVTRNIMLSTHDVGRAPFMIPVACFTLLKIQSCY